jgi:3-hydroxyisobutyrate dehydrogenase-like beta-hydroxyacid dehydrogenase
VQAGASAAQTVADAIAESPLSVICISDYHATNSILEVEEVRRALTGKAVVQLTSGTPREARETEAWMQGQGAAYLDGAILAFPRSIGTPEAAIIVSGAPSPFEEHKDTLDSLGSFFFLGEDVGLASVQEVAGFSFFMSALAGFVHGALIFESEGLSVEGYLGLVEPGLPVLVAELKEIADRIKNGTFDDTDAELNSWAGGTNHLVQVSRDNGIAGDVPEFLSGILHRAISDGHGKRHIAALIESFRQRPIN